LVYIFGTGVKVAKRGYETMADKKFGMNSRIFTRMKILANSYNRPRGRILQTRPRYTPYGRWSGICGMRDKKRLGVLLLFLAQRSPHGTQACFPATAHTGQFSLLCCQPEALFVSVATRTSLFTERYPCGVRARLGHTISAPCGTYTGEQQFTNLAPAWVTGGH